MQNANVEHVLNCLDMISPPDNYEDWLSIGMALYNEGCSLSDWESWSRRGGDSYKEGECSRRWSGFNDDGGGRSIATIAAFIKESGQKVPLSPEYRAGNVDVNVKADSDGTFDMDSVMTTCSKLNFIEPAKVKIKGIPLCPDDWAPEEDLKKQMKALFNKKDIVGFCVDYYQGEDGKYKPQSGCNIFTQKEIVSRIKSCDTLPNDQDPYPKITAAVGTPHEIEGGQIKINPLNGQGGTKECIVDFRHCMIECDEISIDMQYALMLELKLPISVIVHSGNKSLHTAIKVEADSYEEYKERVRYIYKVCSENGLLVDKQCKAPSHFMRMAGVYRNVDGIKKPQYLIGTNIGMKSFDEWYDYIEDKNDDLPEFSTLPESPEDRPELAPELISNMLRIGHKMMVSGPSKAGKSFWLIELAIAIATGTEWNGRKCKQGKILVCNFEIDKASWECRVLDIVESLGLDYNLIKQNLIAWHLRGKNIGISSLTQKMIRRTSKGDFIAIIKDPIYKIMEGDESSSEAISAFTNQLDTISEELGTSVIYCHHHSKGGQSGKKAQDRSSGSGVFARDADALIDMIELEVTDVTRAQLKNNIGRPKLEALCAKMGIDILSLPEDDLYVFDKFSQILGIKAGCNEEWIKCLHDIRIEVNSICDNASAWRIGSTLREFASSKDENMWFTHPFHFSDNDLQLLTSAITMDEALDSYSKPKTNKSKGKKDSKSVAAEELAENNRKKQNKEKEAIKREQKKFQDKVKKNEERKAKEVSKEQVRNINDEEKITKDIDNKYSALLALNDAISGEMDGKCYYSIIELGSLISISDRAIRSKLLTIGIKPERARIGRDILQTIKPKVDKLISKINENFEKDKEIGKQRVDKMFKIWDAELSTPVDVTIESDKELNDFINSENYSSIDVNAVM
jgi:hypothetical protein